MTATTPTPSACGTGPDSKSCNTSGTPTREIGVPVSLSSTTSSSLLSATVQSSTQQPVLTTSTSSAGDATFTSSNTTSSIGSTSTESLSDRHTITSVTTSTIVTSTQTSSLSQVASAESSISSQTSILPSNTLSESSGDASISTTTPSIMATQTNSITQSFSPPSTSSSAAYTASIVTKMDTTVLGSTTQSTDGATTSQLYTTQTSSHSSIIITNSAGFNTGMSVLPTQCRTSDQQQNPLSTSDAISSLFTQLMTDPSSTIIMEQSHVLLSTSIMHDVDVANTNIGFSATISLLPSPSLAPSEPFISTIPTASRPLSVDLDHASPEQSSEFVPTSVSTLLYTVTVSAVTQTISLNGSSAANTPASDASTGKRLVRNRN